MKIKSSEIMNKLPALLAGLFLLAAVGAMCLLLSSITVYSDDYHFGCFFKDGLVSFFDKTADHYLYSNGRLLIHFLLELTLLGDIKIYLFLCPLVICLVAWLLPGLMGRSFTLTERGFGMGTTLCLILGLNTEFLRPTVLWITGSFNYVLPMALVFAAVLFHKKYLTAERIGLVGILFALLAGATTEQYGLFTCIALWGMSIMHCVRIKGRIGKSFILPVVAVIGYLTVLLAPGTWLRVGTESSGISAILDPAVLCSRFQEMSSFITGTNGCLSLLVLFCLVSASLVFAGNHYSKLLMIGYPAALILFLLGKYNVALSVLFFLLYLLFFAIVLVCKKEHTEMGCLLLGSIGSQLILLFVGVYGHRTTFPLIFMVILAISCFLVEIIRYHGWFWYLPVFAGVIALSLHHFIPTYEGYRTAKVTIDENLAAIKTGKETGDIHLNMDVDENYSYTFFYVNSYFYRSFLDYYDIDPDTTKVYLESANDPKVYVNGKQSSLPAICNADGTVFFAVSSVLDIIGGDYVVGDSLTRISFQGINYWLKSDGSDYSLYRDEDVTQLVAGPDKVMASLCGSIYLRSELFQSLFGLQTAYDEKNGCYDLTTVSVE